MHDQIFLCFIPFHQMQSAQNISYQVSFPQFCPSVEKEGGLFNISYTFRFPRMKKKQIKRTPREKKVLFLCEYSIVSLLAENIFLHMGPNMARGWSASSAGTRLRSPGIMALRIERKPSVLIEDDKFQLCLLASVKDLNIYN